MSLYLDTSILVPLHVEEPGSLRLQRWIEEVGEPLLVGDLAGAEFASAISRLIRMGEMTPGVATETLEDFERWRRNISVPIENLPIDIRLAAEFVREPHPPLHAPDAIHSATCKRLGATLVAHDGNLLKVANKLGLSCTAP